MYPVVFYRVAIVLISALGVLSSCSVYDSIFHPHRLGTPAMSPQAKAKARAAEKARHKGLSLQPSTASGQEEVADGNDASGASGSTAAAPAAPEADKAKSYSDLSASIRNTYDKSLLLKRSKLQRMQNSRRQLHHYDLRAPKHTEATRDERKMRKYTKHKNQATPEPKAFADPPPPAPDPTQPSATPASAKVPARPRPAPKPVAPRPAKVAPKPRAPRPAPTPAPAPAVEATPVPAAPAAPAAKKEKKQKAPKAPKPDPTQPLNGAQ